MSQASIGGEAGGLASQAPARRHRGWDVLGALGDRFVRSGRLVMTHPDGRTTVHGEGSAPPVRVTVRDRRTILRIFTNPPLGIGESYMDGGLHLPDGDVYAFLDLIGRNFDHSNYTPKRAGWARGLVRSAWRAVDGFNDRAAARRNVSRHYDLSTDFYRLFLDPDLQYSCAYFARPDMTLGEAQAAKKAHIAAKLRLSPGLRVLDIGCGWGGLGLDLAERGAAVTGVTLSAEQLAVAQARAAAAPQERRPDFRLCDYRDVAGTFDRIVSVGMFEHVGRPNYETYFDTIAARLADDGVAVVHSIGRHGEPGRTDPFVSRHIFPGGYVPALSETLAAVERSGLWVTDVEVLRLHYADTLRAWRERCHAHRAEIEALYDARFFRMWDYYLAVSETGFRHAGLMVFQLQLAKRVDALPVTRGYMLEA